MPKELRMPRTVVPVLTTTKEFADEVLSAVKDSVAAVPGVVPNGIVTVGATAPVVTRDCALLLTRLLSTMANLPLVRSTEVAVSDSLPANWLGALAMPGQT